MQVKDNFCRDNSKYQIHWYCKGSDVTLRYTETNSTPKTVFEMARINSSKNKSFGIM